MKPRKYCSDVLAVFYVLLPKPLLQFRVLHANHHRAGDDGEGGEQPANGKAGAYAPGQHFAKMAEVDGMADAGADARRYEALVWVSGMVNSSGRISEDRRVATS